MTYGEMKDYVLQLLNQYSVAGEPVALTYNNQADAVARIPALVRDGLFYVTTAGRRLQGVAELHDPQERGNRLIYDLPEDFYQLISGGVLGERQPIRDCILVGNRQLSVPKETEACTMRYYRYPCVPEGDPQDDQVLDCPPEVGHAVAFYAAAHLAMEDDNFLYSALYAEFERKMARLSEGVTAQWGTVEDAYV